MSSVLLLTGGPGDAHDFDATAQATADVFRALGHDVDVVDDPDAAAVRLGDGIDVLAVNALRWRMLEGNYATWKEKWAYSPPGTTRRAITDFVSSGGGLLAAHTASICFDDWPGWGDLVGGAWRWGVSSHPPLGTVTVDVVGEHPVVDGLPSSFKLRDEVYGDLHLEADIDVLAVAKRAPDDPDQPVVWTRHHGAGRVVYDAFGHDIGSITAPDHVQLLGQAVTWLVGAS
jgi:hypothetical protein